jgi:hypothetical protein
MQVLERMHSDDQDGLSFLKSLPRSNVGFLISRFGLPSRTRGAAKEQFCSNTFSYDRVLEFDGVAPNQFGLRAKIRTNGFIDYETVPPNEAPEMLTAQVGVKPPRREKI